MSHRLCLHPPEIILLTYKFHNGHRQNKTYIFHLILVINFISFLSPGTWNHDNVCFSSTQIFCLWWWSHVAGVCNTEHCMILTPWYCLISPGPGHRGGWHTAQVPLVTGEGARCLSNTLYHLIGL